MAATFISQVVRAPQDFISGTPPQRLGREELADLLVLQGILSDQVDEEGAPPALFGLEEDVFWLVQAFSLENNQFGARLERVIADLATLQERAPETYLRVFSGSQEIFEGTRNFAPKARVLQLLRNSLQRRRQFAEDQQLAAKVFGASQTIQGSLVAAYEKYRVLTKLRDESTTKALFIATLRNWGVRIHPNNGTILEYSLYEALGAWFQERERLSHAMTHVHGNAIEQSQNYYSAVANMSILELLLGRRIDEVFQRQTFPKPTPPPLPASDF